LSTWNKSLDGRLIFPAHTRPLRRRASVTRQPRPRAYQQPSAAGSTTSTRCSLPTRRDSFRSPSLHGPAVGFHKRAPVYRQTWATGARARPPRVVRGPRRPPCLGARGASVGRHECRATVASRCRKTTARLRTARSCRGRDTAKKPSRIEQFARHSVRRRSNCDAVVQKTEIERRP
jgi:hypothetical protein